MIKGIEITVRKGASKRADRDTQRKNIYTFKSSNYLADFHKMENLSKLIQKLEVNCNAPKNATSGDSIA